MAGLGVWGSFGEEMSGKREDKERKWEALGAFWELFSPILEEKSGKGEHRPQKCVQEILGGSQYDQQYIF